MNRRVRTGPVRWLVLSAFFPEQGVHVVDDVAYLHDGELVSVVGATTAEAMPRVRRF